MATSQVELFHQMKGELLRDHEAAVGRAVDHQAWEKAMENYFHMRDLAAQESGKKSAAYCLLFTGEQSSRESSPEQESRGLW